VGRAFRFLLEGLVAVKYGARAKDLLAEYYPVVGIALAAQIIVGFVGRNLWQRRRAEVGG